MDAASSALNITKGALSVAEGAMDEAAERTVDAQERTTIAEAKLGQWYRHPATWAGVGVVVTLVAEVIIWGLVK